MPSEQKSSPDGEWVGQAVVGVVGALCLLLFMAITAYGRVIVRTHAKHGFRRGLAIATGLFVAGVLLTALLTVIGAYTPAACLGIASFVGWIAGVGALDVFYTHRALEDLDSQDIDQLLNGGPWWSP